MYKDNACWNNPCEDCEPIAPNDHEFICTCEIKFSYPKCLKSKI